MRDARQISSREVSQGVHRHVLTQTTWLGSTVTAHSGPAPLVFRTPTQAGDVLAEATSCCALSVRTDSRSSGGEARQRIEPIVD